MATLACHAGKLVMVSHCVQSAIAVHFLLNSYASVGPLRPTLSKKIVEMR